MQIAVESIQQAPVITSFLYAPGVSRPAKAVADSAGSSGAICWSLSASNTRLSLSTTHDAICLQFPCALIGEPYLFGGATVWVLLLAADGSVYRLRCTELDTIDTSCISKFNIDSLENRPVSCFYCPDFDTAVVALVDGSILGLEFPLIFNSIQQQDSAFGNFKLI